MGLEMTYYSNINDERSVRAHHQRRVHRTGAPPIKRTRGRTGEDPCRDPTRPRRTQEQIQ